MFLMTRSRSLKTPYAKVASIEYRSDTTTYAKFSTSGKLGYLLILLDRADVKYNDF